ncbi:unnamed protein product [Clonostachys rosea]|uniref:Major facilitator superfamily (MFS) profile domain-containing protein n=1 Tax=Bionectria ochroleuca TaxID=29856 RepID=A0ABY6UY50_BIOOC|nr:unnamed protein product [Clonostachys rosea]
MASQLPVAQKEPHQEITNKVLESDPDTTNQCTNYDPAHPHNLSRGRKWAIVLIVSLSSLCVTCASSAYTTTYKQVIAELSCSQEIATLGLSLFIWGMGKTATSIIGIMLT